MRAIALLLAAHAAMASPAACLRKEPLVFPSPAELADKLGDFVADAAKRAIDERGRFVVAIAGGSLPATLGSALLPRKDAVQWSKWDVWLVDERHVPLDHADSNYKAAMDALFSHVGGATVRALNPAVSVEEAALDYQARFTSSVDRFDLVLLGMGPDGHIASLFPGHPLLSETSRVVASIRDSPKPPPQRITFTLPTGASKAEVVARSVDGSGELPAGMVEPSNGALYWFLDADAASKL